MTRKARKTAGRKAYRWSAMLGIREGSPRATKQTVGFHPLLFLFFFCQRQQMPSVKFMRAPPPPPVKFRVFNTDHRRFFSLLMQDPGSWGWGGAALCRLADLAAAQRPEQHVPTLIAENRHLVVPGWKQVGGPLGGATGPLFSVKPSTSRPNRKRLIGVDVYGRMCSLSGVH